VVTCKEKPEKWKGRGKNRHREEHESTDTAIRVRMRCVKEVDTVYPEFIMDVRDQIALLGPDAEVFVPRVVRAADPDMKRLKE
jgi:hypothetical protein